MVHSHTLSLCILPSIGCTALDQRHVVCWGCWHWPSWWFCSNGSSMWSTVQGRELASRLIQHNHHHHTITSTSSSSQAPLITSIISSSCLVISQHQCICGVVHILWRLASMRFTTASLFQMYSALSAIWGKQHWVCEVVCFVQWWLWLCIDLCWVRWGVWCVVCCVLCDTKIQCRTYLKVRAFYALDQFL